MIPADSLIYRDSRAPTSTTILDFGYVGGGGSSPTALAWPYTPSQDQVLCAIGLDMTIHSAPIGTAELEAWLGVGNTSPAHVQDYVFNTSTIIGDLAATFTWPVTGTLDMILSPCVVLHANNTYWTVVAVNDNGVDHSSVPAVEINYSATNDYTQSILWCQDSDSVCTGEPGASAGATWWPYSAFGTSDYYSPTWFSGWFGSTSSTYFDVANAADYGIMAYTSSTNEAWEFLMSTKWPFAWWYQMKGEFEGITTSTVTSTIYVPAVGSFPTTTVYSPDWADNVLTPNTQPFINEIMTMIGWILLCTYMFIRVIKLEI